MSQEIKICSADSGCFLGGLSAADTIYSANLIQGACIVKDGGTSAQFLKADGSVDSNTYSTCQGDVIGIDAGTAITVSDGGTSTPTVGVTSTCNSAWNAKTDCVGTITGVTAGLLLSGGGTSGSVTLGIDSGALNIAGVDSGTACKLTKYNAAGDNIEDSIVTESSSLITVAGALDVDNICSNDTSNNIKYGLEVGAGGISNTGIGKCAANAMTTGFTNIAIGTETMKNANGVCRNIAIGDSAGQDMAAGADDNVAVGACAMFNATTAADNVAIGACSMGVGVTTGSCNVGIGYEAMMNAVGACNNTSVGSQTMRAITTGEFNTAVGFKALCSVVGGDRNVALGNTAGKSITNGCDNVAVGHNALCGLATGCCNVAVGRRAMTKAVTGADNVAIGTEALFENTSGNCNVTLGVQSMNGNTTGSHNVSIGQQAGFYALSGDHNMAMGQYALYDNWGGDYNTAIGTASMQCNTTGSNNAALGYRSMMNNTTGNDNFAVGECALQSNVNGIGNTALGHNAFGSNVTGNYTVAIGDNAGTYFANGCNTLSAASDSIYIGRNTKGKDNNDSNSIVIGYNACSCGQNTIKLGNNAITAACIHVAWTVISDERDKTDVADLAYGLDFIGDLQPKAFKYRNTRTSSASDGVCRYGFLAQDIIDVEDGDDVIVNNGNPEQLGLNSDYLVPILVNAVKDLKARVEALEA